MPVGSISLVLENARIHLADCATFRTMVGAADRAAALPRIYRGGLPAPAGETYTLAEWAAVRPYALVSLPEAGGYTKTSIAEPNSYHEGGTVMMNIVQTVNPAISSDIRAVDEDFEDTIGQIIDELMNLRGVNPYLSIDTIDIDNGPSRSHPTEHERMGDFEWVDLRLVWGGTT